MEDAIKVISTKFKLSSEVLNKVAEENEPIASWVIVLGAYVLDNDKKEEEQKSNENLLRRQRLNAEHQLSQLEKQLISCNTKLTKYEKSLLDVKTKLEQKNELCADLQEKHSLTKQQNALLSDELTQIKQKYSHLTNEKMDFTEVIEKKSKEIDRLTEEWNDISKRLSEANKNRYELQYQFDEIKNSDIRKEFKEKRLEQEKNMMAEDIKRLKKEIDEKTSLAIEFRKDNMGKVLDLETKNGLLSQENEQLRKVLDVTKKTSKDQEAKITDLLSKMKRASEEHIETENNMQQELTAQNKLVELYKEDRDHAKQKLDEVMTAVTELQNLVKTSMEEKQILEARLSTEKEENKKMIDDLNSKIKQKTNELENANDLLQLSRKKGSTIIPDESLSHISPMAAASSAILKKGMTLTQIYTEYVKVMDEFTSEKEENSRLKLYMEQILKEVEEKAPLLMKQKQDYEHAKTTIENMAMKMEQNIKECHQLKTTHDELERNLNFHKREEKRLRTLCVDLSQQVRVLLKEVEEARGGVVSSTQNLPELMNAGDSMNNSSAGTVISEHLVTFKSIEELQAQNERLLLTVRQLSEEQEKLEQEGGTEIIHELKRKIENAKLDLTTLQENHRTQEEMMQQLTRQRDMYRVLCQKGGVMVGDISSTSSIGSQLDVGTDVELTKTKAELNKTLEDHANLKEELAGKENKLNDTISQQEEQNSTLKLECDKLRNQFKFSEERYSILQTSSEGFKKEAKALEDKCKSINEAFVKTRVEAETFKQDYNDAKDRLVSAEVSLKTFETEKQLLKDSEKRLMQENQSLLEQQRSQNSLLTNLQTIQNNLERQEFETRRTLSKQVDSLNREMRALRRQSENETYQIKIKKNSIEKEAAELKVNLGISEEKNKTLTEELQAAKQQVETLEAKCKELEVLNNASEKRLNSILEGDSAAKVSEDMQHELNRYRTRVRELEVELSGASNSNKAIEEQVDVMKKHLEQYKEIGESNEQAINDITKAKEVMEEDFQKTLTEATSQIKNLKTQIAAVVAEKLQMKKSNEETERSFQVKITELRQQNAPLERRCQEITKALINAKEMETAAQRESQEQSNLAQEVQEKYERELVLHAKDVEQLTRVKEELKRNQHEHEGCTSQLTKMRLETESNEKLMEQMKSHHQSELKKCEQVRKDFIAQNSILHGQVEKLSSELAQEKSQTRRQSGEESSTDKSIEEIYELLRFVRREKEIAETKAEASETESMRYRQRAEHLQRDLEETKTALDLELERTKGMMLTEAEHKDIMEKVKRSKELEVHNAHLLKEKTTEANKYKTLQEKVKKLEDILKPLQESKKTLENEKSNWAAEKTALKSDIERWSSRANQLIAQSARIETEKLQQIKTQNEKMIVALQEDVKRTKQQMEVFKRESLKLKNENAEKEAKLNALQSELNQANVSKGQQQAVNSQQQQQQQKSPSGAQQEEIDELKKSFETKKNELAEKTKIVQQLKKLAKKYKTQSDKLKALLTENNIDFKAIIPDGGSGATTTDSDSAQSTAPTPVTAPLNPEEKKKLEAEIQEKVKTINEITEKMNSLQQLLDAEKSRQTESTQKFEEVQAQYIECEKKLLEQKHENEKVKGELNDEKDKNEKNRKFLKTAKEKLASLTKQKDSSQQQVKALANENDELRGKLRQSESSGQNNIAIETINVQLEESKRIVEELQREKNALNQQIEQLRCDLEKAVDEKRMVEKTLKEQQKIRSQPSIETIASVEPMSVSVNPLTATVRPTAGPSSSQQPTPKFHPQSTPTASIRPIAHTAPTAMISPTVPILQHSTSSAPVAPVSVPPFTTTAVQQQVAPQMGEVQGRVRVQVQPQEIATDAPSTSFIDENERPSTSTGNKRQHEQTETTEEEIVSLDQEESSEEPGTKRQKTEISSVDSQELMAAGETDSRDVQIEEDELLAEAPEEEGDDDVMEAVQPVQDPPPTLNATTLREQRLQSERSLGPSPQELLRQQRNQLRGRSQLPSFSLTHGGAVYYDDNADDSTVPSTPTLYMPKRTDGFAEAVSSPVVRYPTFSFSSSEQSSSSSQTPALGQSGELVQQTRMDLLAGDESASVPQTPLGVVPLGNISTSSNLAQSSVSQQLTTAAFFGEDNGQEQNVPQQIDLTEDDDDDDDDVNAESADDVSNDDDAIVDGREGGGELNYQLEEAPEADDGIELFAPVNEDVTEEAEEEERDSEDDPESEDSSTGGDTAEGEVEYQVEEAEEEEEFESGEDNDDVVEITEEEEEEEIKAAGEKVESPAVEVHEEKEIADASAIQTQEESESSSSQVDATKPKPVRLQRTTGVRPRIKRDHLQGLQPPKPEDK